MNLGRTAFHQVFPDHNTLLKPVQTAIPFGKKAGHHLVDLLEPYVVWLSWKELPEGELLSAVCETIIDGLEYPFRPLQDEPAA
jgi:uncharacterized protein (DUF3820 family)